MLLQGKSRWAKVTGKPHPGYDGKYSEWSIDVAFDEAAIQKLKDEGLEKRIRNKGKGDFLTFKRKELKADGTPNQPIRVVDHHGEPWNPEVKIGNDSIVNVNFAINEWGKGEKSANILSLQVWELVPYSGGEFPTREDSPKDDWSKEAEAF